MKPTERDKACLRRFSITVWRKPETVGVPLRTARRLVAQGLLYGVDRFLMTHDGYVLAIANVESSAPPARIHN